MSPKSSKVLRKSKGEAAPTKRSRKVVNFDLAPEELTRVEGDVKVASDAAGVPVSLAGFAKSATLEYGKHRRQLAAIRLRIGMDREALEIADAAPSELLSALVDILEGA